MPVKNKESARRDGGPIHSADKPATRETLSQIRSRVGRIGGYSRWGGKGAPLPSAGRVSVDRSAYEDFLRIVPEKDRRRVATRAIRDAARSYAHRNDQLDDLLG